MKPTNPFPLEALFPGLHKARPEIAALEGERFLAYGAKPAGFDLSDPALRSELLSAVPFIRFQVAPLPPPIATMLAALPGDWETAQGGEAAACAIELAVEQHYNLPPEFRATIVEEKEVWIGWR